MHIKLRERKKKMAVKKYIILNGISQIGNRTVRIAEQLLLVPFFLSMWGATYYGEWLTLSIIPSVLAFSDLGFGTAVSNHFVLEYSGGNKVKSANIYKTGLLIISLTILIGMLLSAIVILIVWKMGMLDKSVIQPADMLLSLVFLMGSRLVSFYSQLFEGFYRANHKISTAFNIYTVEGFAKIGVGIVTLLAGCSIVGYSLGQFLSAILFNILFALLAIRNIKDLPRGNFDKDIAKFTFQKGMGYMLTPIWQSIYMQGSTFAVRIALGPVAVAVFNTIRTVCQSIKSLYAIVNGSIYPELQIAYGKGNNQMVQNIYIYSMQIVFIIGCFGWIVFMLFGPLIYRWWTNSILDVSNFIFYIFLLGIPLNALWWTSGTVFRAFNKPTKFALLGLVSATIATILTYILASLLGLLGAALGFVMMDFLMVVLTLPLANNEVLVSFSDLLNFNNIMYAIKRLFK